MARAIGLAHVPYFLPYFFYSRALLAIKMDEAVAEVMKRIDAHNKSISAQ